MSQRQGPRLFLRCKYGLRTHAYYDEKGTARLDIDLAEMQRLEKQLKKELGRDSTMMEFFEYVKSITTH